MIEVFKPTKGYEGIYEDSNLGRVRSLARINHQGKSYKGKILKPTLDGVGYPSVVLCRDGLRSTCRVHRMVALSHVSGYFEGAVVNHKDEDKTNNLAINLEWVTHQENVEYSQSKRYLVTYPCNTEEVVYNLSKFCRENGLSAGNLCNVAKGRAMHHKGFKCILIGD